MPELPEVEVLARHLAPLIAGRVVRRVEIRRPKVIAPTTPDRFRRSLLNARFGKLARRGKYLLFELESAPGKAPLQLLGHLGMTGRFYLTRPGQPRPKHVAIALDLGGDTFIYEDPRYFGRLTLDTKPLARLGPEPLDRQFTVAYLRRALGRSRQPIKVKLLDQSLIAGIGNIYASEAIFVAGLSPHRAARDLDVAELRRLRAAIRRVLRHAIQFGSTVPLSFGNGGARDGLFYFGRPEGAMDYFAERLRVYDRAGQPCRRCGEPIQRDVQAGRSTFYCPNCQR